MLAKQFAALANALLEALSRNLINALLAHSATESQGAQALPRRDPGR
jgi:hypothetical protein